MVLDTAMARTRLLMVGARFVTSAPVCRLYAASFVRVCPSALSKSPPRYTVLPSGDVLTRSTSLQIHFPVPAASHSPGDGLLVAENGVPAMFGAKVVGSPVAMLNAA